MKPTSADTTVSPECAEQCGIMRLMDTRFASMARGVGTAKILGRIHSAQIKLQDLFLPVAFSVLEGQSVDLLFGLDMLKRHQACIDLSANTLRIGNTEIPFLSEHELPDKAQIGSDPVSSADRAASSGVPPQPAQQPAASSSGSSSTPAPPSNSQSAKDIETVRQLSQSKANINSWLALVRLLTKRPNCWRLLVEMWTLRRRCSSVRFCT